MTDAVHEVRRAMRALYAEVAPAVARDVSMRVEAALAQVYDEALQAAANERGHRNPYRDAAEIQLELPDGVFPEVRAAYEAHDKTCVSLRYMWLARTGGVTCISDLMDCTDCGVTFYNEGVSWLNYDAPPEEDEVRVCACCARARGVTLVDSPHGVTQVREA